MPNKIIIPLNSVTNAAAGTVATVDCPIGPRYQVIWLQLTGKKTSAKVALSELATDLVVKINGKPARSMTAAQLDAINTSYGAGFQARWGSASTAANAKIGAVGTATITDGDYATYRLPIYLAEPWREEYASQVGMAWPTAWPGNKALQSLTVEVTIPTVSNVTFESLVAYAETDQVLGIVDGAGNPVMLISRWENVKPSYSGTGAFTVTTLTKRDRLQQIAMFCGGSDVVGAVKVRADGLLLRDVTKAQNDAALVGRGWNVAGLSAQRFDLAFDYDDVPNSALDLSNVKSLEVEPNMTTAAAPPFAAWIVMYYGAPN